MGAYRTQGVLAVALLAAVIPTAGLAGTIHQEHLSVLLEARSRVQTLLGNKPQRFIHAYWYVKSIHPKVSPQDIIMTIHTKHDPVVERASSSGRLRLPTAQKIVEANPVVTFNQPPGSVKIAFHVVYSATPRKEFSYALLHRMDEAYVLSHARLGFIEMMKMGRVAPRAVAIHFGSSKAGSVLVTCKPKLTVEPAHGGTVVLPYQRTVRGSCLVKLSREPVSIALVIPKKARLGSRGD